MKYLAVGLALAVAFILALLGITQSRKTLALQLTKTSYLESMKNKVSSDVLKESKANIDDANEKLELTRNKIRNLIVRVKVTQVTLDGKKAEVDACNYDLGQIMVEIDDLKVKKNQTEIEFKENRTSLKNQINNLKIQLEKRSQLCDYIMKRSVDGMKLCGIVPVIQAAQNPKADKAAN